MHSEKKSRFKETFKTPAFQEPTEKEEPTKELENRARQIRGDPSKGSQG